jgi:hypothetical protein
MTGVVKCPARRLLHHGRHADIIEATQRQPLHTPLAAEVGDDLDQGMVMGQLGVPVGSEDEDPATAGPHHVPQQQEGRLGGPLEIVEHEEHRLLRRGCGQPGSNGVEEPIPLGVRVGPQRRREARDPLAQLGNQPHQLPAIATETVGQRRRVIGEVAQRLDERLVGHTEVLIAAPGQHHGPFVMNRTCEFGRQPRLAHPRLAGHQRHPQLASRCFLPQLPQPCKLAVPPDEDPPDVGQEGWQRDRGLRERLPTDLDGRDRLGQPLQVQAANGREASSARTSEPTHHL